MGDAPTTPRRRRLPLEQWLAVWLLVINLVSACAGAEFVICGAAICMGEAKVESVTVLAPTDGATIVGPVSVEVEVDFTGDLDGWRREIRIVDATSIMPYDLELARWDPGGDGRTTEVVVPTGAARTVTLMVYANLYADDESNGQVTMVTFDWAP